ncbi:Hypothetical protein YALI2_F01007g [Yarrowia lipolytica]|nr:Hypothetical protein YALI2_F01007g [Yarrowia lipolytica]
MSETVVRQQQLVPCRTKIRKAPTHSLTLKSLAESITNKMIGVDPSLEKPFAQRKKEQVKPYAKDIKKKRVFPAFVAESSYHLDEEDGCTNCGVWVNDGSGREAAESINVDDEDEESDSRQPGEDISDYEDDGFVVDDDEVDDGGDVTGDVTILSDSQASSPAPTSTTVQINDSDLDSEDEQFLPKAKRSTEVTINDSDDDEQLQPRRKHKIMSDSEDDHPAVSRSKKDDDEKPRVSRLKKKRDAVVVLSDEEEEEESSEEDSEDVSDTDNEGITNGVYTGLPSRRRRGGDGEENSEDDSDDDSEDNDLGICSG